MSSTHLRVDMSLLGALRVLTCTTPAGWPYLVVFILARVISQAQKEILESPIHEDYGNSSLRPGDVRNPAARNDATTPVRARPRSLTLHRTPNWSTTTSHESLRGSLRGKRQDEEARVLPLVACFCSAHALRAVVPFFWFSSSYCFCVGT